MTAKPFPTFTTGRDMTSVEPESDVPQCMPLFYGPHPCPKCGAQIVRQALSQGGLSFESEPGPVYPTSRWYLHRCND